MQGEIEFSPDFEKLSQINFGDYLSMIACGSSYYAAMSAVWYFKHLKCFKKINVYDPVDLEPEDITEN
jgi:glucosamine 6-phosphate synthetase-like amidotransferase/phosphosugar isomerase protein